MAVESVNNNNAGYYAAGMAAIGAGAGVSAAYLTRPFLKDNAPTDEFIKKMNDNIVEALPPDAKEMAKELEKTGTEVQNKINKAKDVKEIKKIYLDITTSHLTDEMLTLQKEANVSILESLSQMGVDVKPDQVEKFAQCETVDDVKKFMGEIFDNQYKGKSVEEVKQAMKAESETCARQIAKNTFEQFYDTGKKQFVNCEEGIGKAVKNAAKSIQGKYAAIYGAIGAAILGIGTLLFAGGKEQPQNIDTQA